MLAILYFFYHRWAEKYHMQPAVNNKFDMTGKTILAGNLIAHVTAVGADVQHLCFANIGQAGKPLYSTSFIQQ